MRVLPWNTLQPQPPPPLGCEGALPPLTFEAFCRAVQHHLLYRMQRGRHYVALSLAEAEALRGALHIREACAPSNPPPETPKLYSPPA